MHWSGSMFIDKTFLIDDKFDFMCNEYTNALVATWAGRDYDMMFAEALLIDWDAEADFLLKKKIDYHEWKMYKCLERYHGIRVSSQISRTELMKYGGLITFIAKELKNNYPVWACFIMNGLACFSEEDKKWENGLNYAMLVGMDEVTEQLYFRVIHFHDKYPEVLTMSFREAQRSIYTVRQYKYVHRQQAGINIDYLLAETTAHFSNKQITKKLESFLDYFEKEADYDMIFGGVEQNGLKNQPLIYNLSILYRSRVLFSFCLSYLAVLNKHIALQEIADEMAVNGGKFYNIRGIILKTNFYGTITRQDKLKISDYFRRIIDSEKQLLELMKRPETLACRHKKARPTDQMSVDYFNTPFYFIDLKKYFNNLAFSDIISKDSPANFDGIGGYFLNDKYPYGKLLSVDTMRFLLAVKNIEQDNISCQKQKITLAGGYYKRMMILASSCHGSFKDYFTFVYEDGEPEKVLMASSSFWYPKAHFAETIAWQGPYVMLLNGSYHLESRELNIYAKDYLITDERRLVAIVLPDCPDIHIFALSFQ